ncbi:protein kinase domain-containing protein [Ktedonobacter robiniae]|uniref:non-specific serine/threonine protein kinase n=1 Tax=Ktedonobacter robiniae TaxID=2778365 RepID=A0ABQ3V0F5_9CHLR|nr:protein kinase [Ktedonobacter robiniae]GHO58425.1 hypothetical protein KSB_69000 [Ktedonobacter robiniae]
MSFEGRQLGHYHLLRLIGSGGMGEIYQAEDTHIPRQVAVKVIRDEKDLSYGDSHVSSDAERLFQREMKAISLLDHPHILPVFDYGADQVHEDTLTYLVMPYQPEGSLLDWLRKRGTNKLLAPGESIHILLQAADALQHAHERHIVHQDIKPSNFLIRIRNSATEMPDVLLADFGIAKFINATATVSQSVRGTPIYMSPEQWEGQPVPASDQYALAIMAFQLLTGYVPFRGSPGQVMRLHLTAQPPTPSKLNPQLSAEIDAVLLHALAKRPEERFSSVLQFAQALQQAFLQDIESQSTSIAHNQNSQTASHSLLTLKRQSVASNTPFHDIQEANATSKPLHNLQQASTISPAASPITPALSTPSFRPVISQPVSTTTPTTPLDQQAQPRFRLSHLQKLLLIAGVVLLILSSSIALATVVSRAANSDRQTVATATANSVRTSQANASATTQARKNATATAIANDPYLSGKGTLLVSDPLSVPKLWKNTTSGDWGGTCTFRNGIYHTMQNIGPNRSFHCDAGTLQVSNFIYEVQMTILKGDCGGITFRYANSDHSGYRFRVCADGTARLSVYPNGATYNILFDSASPAIKQGFNQSNVIAAVANSNHVDLYVNKQKIGSATDDTFGKGMLALFTSDLNKPTEIAFSNARIWQL